MNISNEFRQDKNLVIFSHGKESGPWGLKIQSMAQVAKQHDCNVISIDYTDLMDAEQRVQRLEEYDLPEHNKLILVGSSMGGYVSTVAAQKLKSDGLFLMAPAFYLPGYDYKNINSTPRKTAIITGWNDDIVPVENVIRFGKEHKCDLRIVDSDHGLHSALPQICKYFGEFLNLFEY